MLKSTSLFDNCGTSLSWKGMMCRGCHCIFFCCCLSVSFLRLSGVLLWRLIRWDLWFVGTILMVLQYSECLHMCRLIFLPTLLTQCPRCCGEFVANVYALKVNSFVLDRSAGLFHGGLVGGNCVSSIPRNSWASLPKWSLGLRWERCSVRWL